VEAKSKRERAHLSRARAGASDGDEGREGQGQGGEGAEECESILAACGVLLMLSTALNQVNLELFFLVFAFERGFMGKKKMRVRRQNLKQKR
jgi:hypothetical protein